MPYRSLWRRSACTTVAARMAPVAPSGWPSAIAPPIGLTTSGFRPRVLITANAWAAKASFSSIQPMSARLKPAALSAAGIASIGPMPISSGGTPRDAKLTNRASGCKLNCLTAFSLANISAPAPSLVCELLPAVTLPLAANTVRSLASASSVVSARGPSSRLTVRAVVLISPLSRLGVRSTTCTGVISSANAPACCAARALWWDCSANASCASRLTFHCVATFSAVKPMP